MAPATAAYFPRVDDFPDTFDANDAHVPNRPKETAPIFDVGECAKPLSQHDDHFLEENYLTSELHISEDETSPSEAPPSPTNFNDPYLYPILNRNEHLRLTMLWYMMRDAMEDPELMTRLQEKVNLVKDFIGWEYCIMGVLDNSKFTRVITSGLPLAILPRRESTCSHTINQPNGSIFWVSDMSKDWRFVGSPHVKYGGLKSYAGTALLFHTIDGTEVPLGSLCVASDKPDREITVSQQKALKRVAHMLVKEVVTTRRLARHRQRQTMSETLSKLVPQIEALDFESRLLETVRSFYPAAFVTLKKATGAAVELQDGERLNLEEPQHGLWENVDLLEHLLRTQNHKELQTDRTVRAIISEAGTFAQPICLVVETQEVTLIFDDVDAWFVERCARLIWDASQRRLLSEAMRAKETFLRGITHQLRTPIHGVLGAVELLAEELSLRQEDFTCEVNGLPQPMTPKSLQNSSTDGHDDSNQVKNGHAMNALVGNGGLELSTVQKDTKRFGSEKTLQFLETINSSGRELMMTVNNILKLNRWAEMSTLLQKKAVLCDLEQLEVDIVKDLTESLSNEEMMNVSLIFDNQIEEGTDIYTTDASLLRDCIQALVTNAVQWTSKGTVTISMRNQGTTLVVDVTDNGSGINPDFHEIIFQPYEKVDQHTRGAGLGLTLAYKIAEALGGRLTLPWSEVGKGSQFRLELRDAGVACSAETLQARTKAANYQTTCKFRPDDMVVHPLSMHLARCLEARLLSCSEASGIEPGTHVEIDVVNFSTDADTLKGRLSATDSSRLTVCIVPSKSLLSTIDITSRKKSIRFFHGPLTTRRKNEILTKLSNDQSKRERAQAKLESPEQIVQSRIVPKLSTLSLPSAAPSPVALLVDDNPINLTILRMFCKKRGITYHEATDGEQAVQKFESEQNPKINLVLMDLQMPICDGLDATRRIRGLEAKAGITPAAIFMVTGQDSPKDKANSLEAGADEFMVKPVKMKALDETIKAYFGSSAGSTPV